jgi:formamidopyrimidine-DNA glycosylase
MGPEPLTLRTPRLGAALARTRRAIKNALLDQSVIAGLGNIYVDESLFRARIHPLTIAAELRAEQVAALNRSIKATLRKAIHHRGSTLRDYFDANGDPGGFQKLHAVYARAGENCRRCKTPIERIVLAGRSTHFCPRCQARGPGQFE